MNIVKYYGPNDFRLIQNACEKSAKRIVNPSFMFKLFGDRWFKFYSGVNPWKEVNVGDTFMIKEGIGFYEQIEGRCIRPCGDICINQGFCNEEFRVVRLCYLKAELI